MIRRTCFSRVVSATSAIVATVVLGTTSVAFPALSGDRDAWAEISTAFDKMRALPGYRVRQMIARGSTIVNSATFEVVPPDSAHITGQMSPTIILEVIAVGKETRDRVIDHGVSTPWRCNVIKTPSLLPGPDSSQVDITVSRGRDTIIEGTRVRAYSYSYISSAPDHRIRGREDVWIGMRTRLLRRLRTTTESATLTQDFYDYGARIAIILPACG